MECKKAYALVQDFEDGTLAGREAEAFERHVARCAKCAAELEAHRTLATFLDEMEVEEVPAGFGERVIDYLRSTGRILEPVAIGVREGPVWTRVFDWVPARVRVPVAAAAVLLIAVSLVSIVSGQFKGFVGKSTVLATNTYIDVQDTMGSVDVVNRFFEGANRDLRTAKTILNAGLSLLSAAGETLMLPALAMFLMLTIGFGWYLRTAHRRSTQNASYLF